MSLKSALYLSGYDLKNGCLVRLPEGIDIRIRTKRNSIEGEFVSEAKMLRGEKWRKGKRVVYVCEGPNTPMVFTNVPNAYDGDYDKYGNRVPNDADDFVGSEFELENEPGNWFQAISPIEMMKLYRGHQL